MPKLFVAHEAPLEELVELGSRTFAAMQQMHEAKDFYEQLLSQFRMQMEIKENRAKYYSQPHLRRLE